MSYVLTRAQLVVGMGFPVYGIMYVLCTYKSPISCRIGISCVLTRAQLVVGMGFPVKEFCMSYVLTRAQLVVGMGFPVYGIMDVLCTYKSPIGCRNGISCVWHYVFHVYLQEPN